MREVEPFDVFLARTAAARWEDYADVLRAGGATTEREAAAEFDKMKAYILDSYRGVRPVGSFLDAAGNPVDCVPFEQQPTVRTAVAAGATFPPPPPPRYRLGGPGPAAPADSAKRASPALCPSGAVPVPRITLERMAALGTFDNYFRKKPFPSSPAGGA
jgi:hypothetical protein